MIISQAQIQLSSNNHYKKEHTSEFDFDLNNDGRTDCQPEYW
jgi:hypothetical protein